ncbi:MAG: thiopurine S-methyltransferase [Kofleriaceae bacterium]
MDPSFWHARWEAGQIGFHEGRPNDFLVEFGARLGSARRVLVPLCGKSADLAYLAGLGHQVIGVELVEAAAAAFFAEHGLAPQVDDVDGVRRYHHGAIAIVVGDLFDATTAQVGPADALYDRAALIALPASTRPRYVAHLRALLPAGAPGLVVTLDYPQTVMDGPPFALSDDEVRAYYPTAELLADTALTQPRLAALGVTGRERCYAVATTRP